jgi:Tfp pilus assembly protein PilN
MRAVNLIPADQRGGSSVGVSRSGGAAYAVVAMFAGLAVMALLYGLAQHQISSRKAQSATLTAKAQRAQSAAAQLAPYTSFIALRQQRAQAVAQLVGSRFDWAHAFHEFGRVLPSDASISSLDGAIGAVGGASTSSGSASSSAASAGSASVASATPPGSVPTFTLSGCATSQSAVAETINRLRLIDGVTSVTLQSSTKSGSGGGTGGSGGCTGSSPAFNMQVAYQPLPTQAAVTSTTTTVAAPGRSGPAVGASKSAGAAR